MIPTSVHGHMPFVKESNSTIKTKCIPYEKNNCKSCDCGVKFEGSLSRKKVLRISKDQRLDSIPENIKNDILTKDRTWYAVVRALFRKGSKKKENGREGAKDGDAGVGGETVIDDSTVRTTRLRDAPVRLCEASRSKSLRLASIEEEADSGSTISISMNNIEPIRLISLVDSNLMLNQLSLSDQLKRKATSTLLKAHEDLASLSSSSESIPPTSSQESLSTT